MNTPKTAVIPAAGKGTRFLPSTKATPKEMHPLLNVPLIHHCIEELAQAGVEKVIIVSHKSKTGLNKYFEDHLDLKDLLKKDGKTELVNRLESIENFPEVVFSYQEEQLGLAHAIYSAKDEIKKDDFFVLLPDEIFIPSKKEENPSLELLNLFNQTKKSCITLLEVPKEKVSSYGVAKIKETESNSLKVIDVIEKPKIEEAPSNLILPGRYLLSNKILDIISKTKPSKNGEVYLTDSLITLSQTDDLYGHVTKTPRFDGGSVVGFLKANLYKAMQDKNLKSEILELFQRIN